MKLSLSRQRDLANMRACMQRGLVKLADIEGDQDTSFEQSFSNLAHSYIRERAPGLLDYEVGFQLVDKSDDNARALGVIGFKLGKQWLYGPVFFINGELKGHELLYIKNQDLIVPMTENWLNFILNRKPHVLGDSVPRDLARLGVLPPNFYQLSRSPGKFASDQKASADPCALPGSHLPLWVRNYLPSFAHQVTTSPLTGSDDILDLPSFLKLAGTAASRAFLQMVIDYPVLMDGLETFHGKEKIAGALDAARRAAQVRDSVINLVHARRARAPSNALRRANVLPGSSLPDSSEENAEPGDAISKRSSVHVIHFRNILSRGGAGSVVKSELKSGEREKLLRGKVVIRDERLDDEVTVPYHVDINYKELVNPSESGIYDVLVRPHEFAKCAIFLGLYGANGRTQNNTVLVVRLGNRSWLTTSASDVWTKGRHNLDEMHKFCDDLPAADSLEDADSSEHVVISPSGNQATFPFHVHRYNGGLVPSYGINFLMATKKERPSSFTHRNPVDDTLEQAAHAHQLVLTGKPGQVLRAAGDALYAPEKSKLLTLDGKLCGCGSDSEPPPALVLGNMADIYTSLMSKEAGLAPVTLRHDGTAYTVNDSSRLEPEDAVVHLVRDHGLREVAARDVLEKAAKERVFGCLFKYAEPRYDLQNSAPGAPPMPEPIPSTDPFSGGRAPVQPGMSVNLPIPGLTSQMSDRYLYHPADVGPYNTRVGPEPDYGAVQSAMQAAQTGQKEIFDTSLIASIVKTTDLESVLDDKVLGSIVRAVDSYGRLLMHYYWNRDQWEDRFGKQELKELESTMRDTFLQTGDLLLSLREKRVDSGPEEGVLPNLADIAGH